MRADGGDAIKKVPLNIFVAAFSLGWTDTVTRLQGGTFREPFNIFEAKMMNKNQLYTAISRGTTLSHVGLSNLGDQKFLPAVPPEKGKQISVQPDEVKVVIIYKLYKREDIM